MRNDQRAFEEHGPLYTDPELRLLCIEDAADGQSALMWVMRMHALI